MSKLVLLDARLFVGGADLAGAGNRIELAEQSEAKKITNWKSGGADELLAGLTSVDASASGQWEAGDPTFIDDAMWASRRVVEPWSAGPTGASDLAPGNLMYLTQMLRTKSTIWGNIGDVAGYDVTAVGSWPLVRGVAAHASGVPRSAAGNGASVELGAVPAGRYLYANLHVLSVAGTAAPSITVKIQSDSAVGFPSPVDQFTFPAKTAIGGQAVRIPGPITDTWYRVTWTVTGTGPSFLFLASLGIE